MQPTCSGDKTVSCNSTSFQFSTKALTEPGRGLGASPDICGSSSELPIFFVATSSGSFPLSNIVPSESSVLTSWSEESPVRWGENKLMTKVIQKSSGKSFVVSFLQKIGHIHYRHWEILLIYYSNLKQFLNAKKFTKFSRLVSPSALKVMVLGSTRLLLTKFLFLSLV